MLVPIAVVLALFLLSIAVTLYLRPAPFLPNHGDEWDLLAYVKEMQKTGTVVQYDPTTMEPLSEGPHYKLEMNYHLFALSLYNLSGMDILILPFFVVVILSFLFALASFVLVRDFTKNSLAAFIAAVFVFGLKNNVALLGYAFMTPMGLGLAMVPLLIYSFIRGLESNRFFLIFAILILNTFFTHPVYAVLIVPAAIVFFLFRPKLLLKNFTKLFALAAIVFALGLFAVRNLLQKDFSQSVLKLFVFPHDPYMKPYPLIGFLEPLEFAAIAIGLIFLVLFSLHRPDNVRKTTSKVRSRLDLFFVPEFSVALFALIFSVIWVYLRFYSESTDVCFFGPCRRTSTGFVAFLLIIAGLGFFLLAKFLLENVFKSKSRIANSSLTVLGSCLLTVVLFYYVLLVGFQYKETLYSVITPVQLPDLEWMGSLPKNSVVFSPMLVSKAVFVVSDLNVPAMPRARLGNFSLMETNFNPNTNVDALQKNPLQEIGYFLQQGGEKQRKIIKKYGITNAYWQSDIECLNSDRIFDSGDWRVSKFTE